MVVSGVFTQGQQRAPEGMSPEESSEKVGVLKPCLDIRAENGPRGRPRA